VVQKPPVMLDRAATIARVVETIGETAANGASLVVFPETYIPGYPFWAWRLQPGRDLPLLNEIHARLRENAIDMAAGHDPVREAAPSIDPSFAASTSDSTGRHNAVQLRRDRTRRGALEQAPAPPTNPSAWSGGAMRAG
jgi:nitrilase